MTKHLLPDKENIEAEEIRLRFTSPKEIKKFLIMWGSSRESWGCGKVCVFLMGAYDNVRKHFPFDVTLNYSGRYLIDVVTSMEEIRNVALFFRREKIYCQRHYSSASWSRT